MSKSLSSRSSSAADSSVDLLALSAVSSSSLAACSAAAPTTPTRPITKTFLLDSADRKDKRMGSRPITLDMQSIDMFRNNIAAAYINCFSKFVPVAKSRLSAEFLQKAYDSYIDSNADTLVDDDFDPADLSAAIIAVNNCLPLFVDNKAMKKQVNKQALRHSIVKDVVIVDVNEIAKPITKESISAYCKKSFPKKSIAGMGRNGILGVADTGFISELAKSSVDASLEGAFMVPEFVMAELERITAKLTVQFRSPEKGETLKYQTERLDVARHLCDEKFSGDFLQLTPQPAPDLSVLQSFDRLKNLISEKLQHINPQAAKQMLTLVRKCVAHRSVMDHYNCSELEINYLYETYKMLCGAASVSKSAFDYKSFLADIVSVDGLTAMLDDIIAKDRHASIVVSADLKAGVSRVKLDKSQKVYDLNGNIKDMALSYNEAFGHLYNLHRSLKNNSIKKDIYMELCLQFHKYVYKTLDKNLFEAEMADRSTATARSQQLSALTSKLSDIFNEIDDRLAAIRFPSQNTTLPTSSAGINISKIQASLMTHGLCPSKGDSLAVPVGNATASSAGLFSTPKKTPALQSLGSSAGNSLSLVAPEKKHPQSHGKENLNLGHSS